MCGWLAFKVLKGDSIKYRLYNDNEEQRPVSLDTQDSVISLQSPPVPKVISPVLIMKPYGSCAYLSTQVIAVLAGFYDSVWMSLDIGITCVLQWPVVFNNLDIAYAI